MNLIVSRYYDTNYNDQKNMTADYNLMHSINYLVEKYPNEFITYDTNFYTFINNLESLDNFFTNVIKLIPKNILLVSRGGKPSKEIIEKYDIDWYLFIIDMHNWGEFNFYSNKIKLLLPYAYTYNFFNFKYDYTKYFFPHCVVHSVNYNKDPINKILGSGRGYKNKNRYPNRHKFFQLALKNNKLLYHKAETKYRINVNIRDISNYSVEKKFIDLLNKYRFCFCDDLTYPPFIVAKFFEITSSGSLLITTNNLTKEYFTKLGFIDKEDYISINENDMLNELNKVLSMSTEEIDKIRMNGYIKAWKNHSYIKRAEELYEILNDRIENYTLHKNGINGTNFWCYNYINNEINNLI